ncbi:SLIT-ROBO Rho GTPase-activating protein 3-like [Diaphorina citri]|uniref:SLIT-ROBO Rho GTPase-activating protein 3-like n=1 Tax=Diaphorina citri TaxID=121845 RepID=A0A1S4EA70_DIACI|nr:SLIT-ROBO Rho GTPase-activating protein 3-like [Diaphorina citri]
MSSPTGVGVASHLHMVHPDTKDVYPGSAWPTSAKPQRRKRPGGRSQHNAPPKLFGGSLEEYVEATGQEIPLVCRDIGYELHEELMRVLRELHATTKDYLAYQAEARQAEVKLRSTEAARNKIEQSLSKEKLERSKKFRVVEKEVQKVRLDFRHSTYDLLGTGMYIHRAIASALRAALDRGSFNCQGRQKSESAGLEQLQNLVQGMDSRLDKKKFMEYNHSAFMIPKKFEFQGQKDEFAEPELQRLLCCDMETRLVQINQRLTNLKTESEEIWKTLETAEISLLEMLTAKDYDCSELFTNNNVASSPPPETVSIKLRADKRSIFFFPELESKHEFVVRMRDLLAGLPRPCLVLLRYIFAFLNHLSEYADENMMDPYNLAICFGPTLVPVPDDKDQVQYQNQVNELIKNVILFSEDIFPSPSLLPGPVYEKYISPGLEEDEDIGDCPSESVQEVCPSEDECDSLEATAQFEFLARSDRELSLKKGDHITLYNQVSNDWWRGSVAGQEGLIPDKYIMLKIKDESSDKLDSGGVTGSGGQLSSSPSTTSGSDDHHHHSLPQGHVTGGEGGRRRRVSSSNDSSVSGATNSNWSGEGGGNSSETCSLDDSGRHSLGPDDCLILPDGRYSPGYDRLSRSIQRELETKFRTANTGGSVIGGSIGGTYSTGNAATSGLGDRGFSPGTKSYSADAGDRYSPVNPAYSAGSKSYTPVNVSGNVTCPTGGDAYSTGGVTCAVVGGAYSTLGGGAYEQPTTRGRSHWKSASVDEKKPVVTKDDTHVGNKGNFSHNRDLWARRASSHTQLSGGALSLTKEEHNSHSRFKEEHNSHSRYSEGDAHSEGALSKEGEDVWSRYSKDTPDLVMDLPDLSQKTRLSREDTLALAPPPSEPESPDMSTTAERFAKHQCTLRKNTKSSSASTSPSPTVNSQTPEPRPVEDPRTNPTSPEVKPDKPPVSPLPLTPGDKPQVTPKPALMRKPVITQHSPLILRRFQTRSPDVGRGEKEERKTE